MKKLAIIGASELQNPLIEKAKELGYETHVFAWKTGDIGEKTADYFYPISIIEKEKILNKCEEIEIDGITTIASDLATITVNYVCENMNLSGNTMECTMNSTNKYRMRKKLQENGIPTPKFEIVEAKSDVQKIKNMEYPLIVKPTDRSGSRGIEKVYNKEELEIAIEKSINQSFEKKVIVEEYIDGQEYSAEGITFKGKHKFLTITKKSTTGEPNFIETGHIEPSGISIEKEKIIYKEIENALDALGIYNSATHSEFKINSKGEIRIIEIGARMGGDCIGSDLVQISTGYDYLKMVIDVAMGLEPNFEKISTPQIAVIKFIFNDKDIETLEKIKMNMSNKIHKISEAIKECKEEITDSSTRYGFYILKSKNIEDIGWVLKDE